MSITQMRGLLADLQARRAMARESRPDGAPYLADLEEEIAVRRATYVTAAVLEIASLRAELSGPQRG